MTSRIYDLYGVLHTRALSDARLANVATHAVAVPAAFGAARLVGGRVVLPIPDTPAPRERVYLESDLTYEQNIGTRVHFGVAGAVCRR